jgi:5'-3' exonuclease
LRLLIDLDTIVYRGAYISENYFYQVRACDNILVGILEGLEYTSYEMFLSGPNNFRKLIDPNYKSNRTTKPPNLFDIRQYFVKYWGAQITEGEETDDAISKRMGPDTITAAEDKDYLTVPGLHYRIYMKGYYFQQVSEDEANLNFYIQTMIGDASDNVPGLPNPAKKHFAKPPNFSDAVARELLTPLTPEERREKVKELFQINYGDQWFQRFDTICRLLFLRREDGKEYSEYF